MQHQSFSAGSPVRVSAKGVALALLGVMIAWPAVAGTGSPNRCEQKLERLDSRYLRCGMRETRRASRHSREPVMDRCVGKVERHHRRLLARDPSACLDFDVQDRLVDLDAQLEQLVANTPWAEPGPPTVVIDASGAGTGKPLTEPWGIAASPRGDVYVPGSKSNNLFRIDRRGRITQIMASSGTDDGQCPADPTDDLFFPSDVAVGRHGFVYVNGRNSCNIFRIDRRGNTQRIADRTGDGTHELNQPFNVAVDRRGNVYTAGVESNNAFRIARDGTITQIIDASGDGAGHTLEAPQAVAVDYRGNVFVTGSGSNNLFKVTRQGVVTQVIGESGDGSASLEKPQDVVVDRKGNAYVAGFDSSNVFKITPAGEITEIVDASGDGTSGGQLDNIRGVAVDRFGNVYVAGYHSGNVVRVSASGEKTLLLSSVDSPLCTTGTPPCKASAIAIGRNATVYIAGALTNNAIAQGQ